MIDKQETSQKSLTGHKPSWISFPIGELTSAVSHGATALLGHHLVVVAQGLSYHSQNSTKLWVIDLQDHSFQKGCKSPLEYYSDVEACNFSFSKYGENQIIQFGGGGLHQATNLMIKITIQSFKRNILGKPITHCYEALEIQYERPFIWNAPSLSGHTAEIYQDCMYVFGGRNANDSLNEKLWCFDISMTPREEKSLIIKIENRNWTECKTTGKAPQPREGARSFIRDDNLYIYGGYLQRLKTKTNYNELFELNLSQTMKWRKIQQTHPQTGQDSKFYDRLSVDVYGENMLVLKNEKKAGFDKLYCCNRNTLGSWSMVDVGDRVGLGGVKMVGNSVTYNNKLYACVTNSQRWDQVCLAVLDLERVGLFPPRSSEEEQLASLFMNENESDVAFKIEDKLIPAHKKILIEKCKFFDNLFKSGMLESRLGVIEINDCEFDVFKEFVRFLYCGTIDVNASQAMRLFLLADKYIQEDMHDKCVNALIHNINEDNVSDMLDFAFEYDLPSLKDWCMKIYQNGVFPDTLEQKIQDLENIKMTENGMEKYPLIEVVLGELVFEKFIKTARITKKCMTDKVVKFCEDFLRKKLTKQKIHKHLEEFISYEKMANLQDVLLNFVFINFNSTEQNNLCSNFLGGFGQKFEEYKWKKIQEKQKENEALAQDGSKESTTEVSQKDNNDASQRKAVKRINPTEHSIEEEEEEEDTGPILKKTKQSIDGSRN